MRRQTQDAGIAFAQDNHDDPPYNKPSRSTSAGHGGHGGHGQDGATGHGDVGKARSKGDNGIKPMSMKQAQMRTYHNLTI